MGRKAIYQSIFHQLRYQILSGEWPIGSPLPPERKLAEELHVSRNTIVRAYAELESEGLIESRVGSGRYVQPLSPLSHGPRDDWREQLVREPMLMAYPSHMAEMLSLSSPGQHVINFAHGDGGKHTLPSIRFDQYLQRAAQHPQSYYFLPIDGHVELRQWIVDWMGMKQVSSPDQVVVTSGSQEALQMVTTILAKPGDTIALEMPTYFGALQLFQSLGMKIIPIPVDTDGMRVDVLEGVVARVRPKLIYTVPTFHNPTGNTLSYERRKRLLAVSERYGIPIIEDDAYRHLHFEKEPPPPLKSMDQSGHVIYLNTFSKMLFPGMRLGWVAASRPFIEMVRRLKELTITNNTMGQWALLYLLQDQVLTDHLIKVRKLYAQQAKVMGQHLDGLAKRYGLAYEQPAGGFYYWVSLPERFDVHKVQSLCLQRGVAFASGDMFLSREAISPYIRLCYTHEAAEQIESGMHVLGEVLQELEGN
ncbi:PLP-dependent aminotransferase family protein [Brevibacillus dissolubilis]|uniref:MocR-like pyridoxine biosynthesis transcription factor PdxR n=1 Tax=Brevibacillus dissolubilis TaxID=1844116 RepID=UPI0011178487|nr:PLP-dependent aminotransferase family protein [Brevibacillus dissolubilis]